MPFQLRTDNICDIEIKYVSGPYTSFYFTVVSNIECKLLENYIKTIFYRVDAIPTPDR